MSSFKGSYRYSIDSKGRINLPAKLRKYMSPEANDLFVATRGYDNCIFIYPQDEWTKLEQSIRHLSSTNPKQRFFTRTLCQYATELALDGQSRLSLPRELLQIAGLENEALIVGVLERIEIWNPKKFEEYQKGQPESYETVAQTVFEQ